METLIKSKTRSSTTHYQSIELQLAAPNPVNASISNEKSHYVNDHKEHPNEYKYDLNVFYLALGHIVEQRKNHYHEAVAHSTDQSDDELLKSRLAERHIVISR